jgi:peroxiredoxin
MIVVRQINWNGQSSCSVSNWLGRSVFACVLTIILNMLTLPVASEPLPKGILEALSLSGYPATMNPPEFSGLTAAGRRVSLSDLRGRVVLLNFWASWCQECRPEMPAFEQLHRDFTGQGLTVLGVNIREGRQAIQSYGKELGLTFPLVLDSDGEIRRSYGVIGLPTTFLIGRDGRTVALAVGPREWSSVPARAIIQVLLTESVGTKVAP